MAMSLDVSSDESLSPMITGVCVTIQESITKASRQGLKFNWRSCQCFHFGKVYGFVQIILFFYEEFGIYI
jgi:hypothetical protein